MATEISDKERIERRWAEAARRRDIELANAQRGYEARIKSAKERYEAALADAERVLKAQRENSFRICEGSMDAIVNFVNTKNDAARIRQFGLGLPFIHDTNTFGRRNAQETADRIAAQRTA